MSQKEEIIKAMKHRFISPLDALKEFGCYRFSARIWEIRRHHDVAEKMNTRADGIRYKSFKIKGSHDKPRPTL